MQEDTSLNGTRICQVRIKSIKDTMDILSGKWKFHIIGTLLQVEGIRFMQLLRALDGIAPKILSKELKDLEMNHLVERTVLDTKPITVEYKLTPYGRTLEPIIDEIARWGIEYRKSIYEQTK